MIKRRSPRSLLFGMKMSHMFLSLPSGITDTTVTYDFPPVFYLVSFFLVEHSVYWAVSINAKISVLQIYTSGCPRCLDAVGWAAGRASGLYLVVERVDGDVQSRVVPLHLLSLLHVHLHRATLGRADASHAEHDEEHQEPNADDRNHRDARSCHTHTDRSLSLRDVDKASKPRPRMRK